MPKLKPETVWPEPSKVELTREFDEIVESPLSFDQIAEKYGEETAIRVGIARYPDTVGTDEYWSEYWSRARPAAEVVPHIVERWRRAKSGKQKLGTKERIT